MINTKDLDPSADLARYRTSVSRLFVVLSWLLVPALSAVAGSSHFRTQWSVTAAAFALASAATAAMLVGGSRTWPRLVIAVVLTGMAGIFVNVASEPWQVDYHMVLFAALAMLAAYADWRPVALAATLMPLYHLAHLEPVAAYSGGPARLAVHFAILCCDSAVLIWVALRFEGSFIQSSRMYAQLALTDDLTKLGNHIAYREDLRTEISRVRLSGVPLVLALFNIDELTTRGDAVGLAGGEPVIMRLASALESSRRHDGAYRVGGDDFALIMRSTSLGEAHRVVRQLHHDALPDLRGARVSVGLAIAAADSSADLLHAQAEAALYDAKRRGQNSVVAFNDLGAPDVVSSAKADALRSLIGERAVDIAFQPIWDRAASRLLGFEALARPAARLGFDGPQEAFDVADALHLTEELDALCREVAFSRAHEVPAEALLFINVSPLTLERRLLPGNTLVDVARAAGIEPNRVVLEITERSRARTGPVIEEATRLRGLGFQLALDDTGAGNAGLEMLSRMTVDFVKIDGDVIAKITKQRTARGVFAGIVAIARETGAYLIAEGIEDTRTLASVASLRAPFEAGVAGLQGYLIGRPTVALPQNGAIQRYEAAIGKRVGGATYPRAVEQPA